MAVISLALNDRRLARIDLIVNPDSLIHWTRSA